MTLQKLNPLATVIQSPIDVLLWLHIGSRCFQRALISKKLGYFNHEKAFCHPCCTGNKSQQWNVIEHIFSGSCCTLFSCCFLLNRGLLLDFESRHHLERKANMKLLLWSAVHHILQWLLGSFCEHPSWLYGPCTECLTTLSSISSQRPVFFFLTLLSRSTVHKQTEIGKRKVSPVNQETFVVCKNWLPLCKNLRGLCNPWENLWFKAFNYDNCPKVFEFYFTVPSFRSFTLISLWMPLALFVTSCELFSTDLPHVPRAALVETFK